MLHGRDEELGRVMALVEDALEGRSGALVLSGEPGIGKTALLRAAEEHASTRMQLLRARGYESERDLPFAGLYALLSPVLELRKHIPPVQARALGTALAVDPPSPYDPFAVPAAVLSMLATVAEQGPVLAVVDDVHWLDQASLRAVLFAARRLGAEGVAVLLGARDADELRPLLAGLPALRPGPLDDAAARALLDEVTGGGIAEPVVADLIRTAGGNPLALRELPLGLTAAQRAGLEPPLLRLPQGSAVERGFEHRFDALDDRARRALAVLAALDSGPVSVALDALGRIGLGLDELEAAEEVDLVVIERGEVAFRHPVLRSLAYHGAPRSARLAAHRALTEVVTDPSQRAWHLSSAALGADDAAAGALDEAARIARARGASAEAAAAAQRAAELSSRPADAIRRLTAAAADLAVAGRAGDALAAIERATALQPDGEQEAALRVLRGRVDIRRGAVAEGREALAAQAERAAPADPLGAAFLYLEAGVADITLGDTARILHDGRRAQELAAGRDRDLELSGVLLQAAGLVPPGRSREAEPLFERAGELLARPESSAPAELVAFGAQVAMWMERYDIADTALACQLAALRDASAIGRMPFALAVRAHLDHRLGRWPQALAEAAEGVALARQTGQVPQIAFCLAVQSIVESGRGQVRAAAEHAREADAIVDRIGGPLRIYSAGALGFAALLAERLHDALDHFRSAAAAVQALGGVEPAMLQFDGEYVELLARLGQRDAAEERLAWLAGIAEATGRAWANGTAARLRGQLAPDDAFAAHFEQALAWAGKDRQPFATARAHLAYGQRLRRVGERTASREQLGAAAAIFDRLGAARWLERTQDELDASGQTLRRRSLPESDELTPSELQVALRVAEGLTNREVAAAIFLSPKTVEHHLSAIYRKLGIRSRTELARLLAEAAPDDTAGSGGTSDRRS